MTLGRNKQTNLVAIFGGCILVTFVVLLVLNVITMEEFAAGLAASGAFTVTILAAVAKDHNVSGTGKDEIKE